MRKPRLLASLVAVGGFAAAGLVAPASAAEQLAALTTEQPASATEQSPASATEQSAPSVGSQEAALQLPQSPAPSFYFPFWTPEPPRVAPRKSARAVAAPPRRTGYIRLARADLPNGGHRSILGVGFGF
jgi:hypothetical protein